MDGTFDIPWSMSSHVLGIHDGGNTTNYGQDSSQPYLWPEASG